MGLCNNCCRSWFRWWWCCSLLPAVGQSDQTATGRQMNQKRRNSRTGRQGKRSGRDECVWASDVWFQRHTQVRMQPLMMICWRLIYHAYKSTFNWLWGYILHDKPDDGRILWDTASPLPVFLSPGPGNWISGTCMLWKHQPWRGGLKIPITEIIVASLSLVIVDAVTGEGWSIISFHVLLVYYSWDMIIDKY